MIRLSTLFWLIAVSTAGFAMFAVKYEVQSLADQLARTVKQADGTERDIRVLDAEWAYLNRPDVLAQLNQQLLSLTPIATKQLRTSLADIPMRPAPPPPPAPVQTVSADAPITVPTTSVSATVAPATPAPQPDGDAASSRTAQALVPTPVQISPAGSAHAIVTVALDAPASAQSIKPAPVKAMARSNPPHRAASLNALIAQIVESRR